MVTELETKLEQMGKKAIKALALILVLTVLLFDYACINRTMAYTSCGWEFMRASRKAAEEVSSDICEVWNLVIRKLGFGPAWTETWSIPNANINWNSLAKGE